MQAKPGKKVIETKKEPAPTYIKKGSKDFIAFMWFLEQNFKKANSKSLCLE